MLNKYKIILPKSYYKDLKKIPTQYRNDIDNCIKLLTDNPRPFGCKKLKGNFKLTRYRIRVGKYRVIYSIQDKELIVLVIEIDHRKDVYR